MVNEKQCTITWYVDNLNISHINSTGVDNIITIIEPRYGTMTVTRGNKHVYIGILIEFIGNGKVILQ